jgi:hypothetical protein
MRATRHSTRHSHDLDANLLELTNSGRHARPVATNSVPPEASKRPVRGGKTTLKAPAKTGGKAPVKTTGKAPAKTAGKAPAKTAGKGPAKTAGKQPSLILEESNESNSIPTKDDNDGEPDSTDVLVESIERDPGALEIADSEPDFSADERLEDAEDKEEEEENDDDDDEDGPVRPTRTRSQKNMVCFLAQLWQSHLANLVTAGAAAAFGKPSKAEAELPER